MKHLDPNSLDAAFVAPGTRSLADVIDGLLSTLDVLGTRTRDMVSGLRTVARAIGRTPEEIPADPRWLRTRLAKVEPAALGLTAKTWSNALSNAKAGLAEAGIVERRNRRKSELSPAWRSLWTLVLASENRTLKPALCRFVHFLDTRGVAPQDVTDADAVAFRDALAENEISKSPETTMRMAVNGWRQACRLLPDWPQVELTLPNRSRRVKLAEGSLPESFTADLDRLARSLTEPDPLSENGRLKSLRPATVAQYRAQLLRFAAELVRSGVEPDRIVDVATLCRPEMAERGLRRMLSGNDNQTNPGISETAALLRNLSTSFCRAGEADRKALATFAKRVATKKRTGMTAKNRERLRVLQDDRNLLKLVNLPDRLFAEAKSGRKPHYRALDREIAVAIEILLVCPLRVKNLAEIHLERNIHRPGRRPRLSRLRGGRDQERAPHRVRASRRRDPDDRPAPRVPMSGTLSEGNVLAVSEARRRVRHRSERAVRADHQDDPPRDRARHQRASLPPPRGHGLARGQPGRIRGGAPASRPRGTEPHAEPLFVLRRQIGRLGLLPPDRGEEEGGAAMSLNAPLAEWPEEDREMWRALISAGNPLDDMGALAHLRSTSLKSLIANYGRWIAWLRDTDAAALALPPSARATMPRLTAWLDGLAHTRPMTRLAFVSGALRVLRAAAPDADWTRQRRLEAMLKSAAGRGTPERKAGRILDSSVLLDAGLRLAGPGGRRGDDAAQGREMAARRRDGRDARAASDPAQGLRESRDRDVDPLLGAGDPRHAAGGDDEDRRAVGGPAGRTGRVGPAPLRRGRAAMADGAWRRETRSSVGRRHREDATTRISSACASARSPNA